MEAKVDPSGESGGGSWETLGRGGSWTWGWEGQGTPQGVWRGRRIRGLERLQSSGPGKANPARQGAGSGLQNLRQKAGLEVSKVESRWGLFQTPWCRSPSFSINVCVEGLKERGSSSLSCAKLQPGRGVELPKIRKFARPG